MGIGTTTVPKYEDIRNHSKYTTYYYEKEFGSYSQALKHADIDVYEHYDVPRERLIEEIENLAPGEGVPPQSHEMRSQGKYHIHHYVDEFGSWNNALLEAGYEIHQHNHLTDEELLEEIRNLKDQLGEVPSSTDLYEIGNYSLRTYQTHFGSWNKAVRKAGFEPKKTPSGPDNPNWKGGYEPYYGPNWYEKRREALERDSYNCQVCGITNGEHVEKTGSELSVHHIRPIRQFESTEKANQLDNLITLCKTCHRKWEGVPVIPDRETDR